MHENKLINNTDIINIKSDLKSRTFGLISDNELDIVLNNLLSDRFYNFKVIFGKDTLETKICLKSYKLITANNVKNINAHVLAETDNIISELIEQNCDFGIVNTFGNRIKVVSPKSSIHERYDGNVDSSKRYVFGVSTLIKRRNDFRDITVTSVKNTIYFYIPIEEGLPNKIENYLTENSEGATSETIAKELDAKLTEINLILNNCNNHRYTKYAKYADTWQLVNKRLKEVV